MDKVRLGMTDLHVSPICFGTWQLGGDWGRFDERDAIEAIRHALQLGVTIFDTAQAYGFGASEHLLGRALAPVLRWRRDDVTIATKGGLRPDGRGGVVRDGSPAWLREGVEQSLRALGVDHIDLYQLHWPDPAVPVAETAGELQELVDEGKIRHVGVSNFDAPQMAVFARTRPVETLQPPYHLFRRGIEADVLPYCAEHDIGVLVYGPLAHGLLTGTIDIETAFEPGDWRAGSPVFRRDALRRNVDAVRRLDQLAQELGTTVSALAIAWTLANPGVDVAIVGARSVAHIEDSVGAAALWLAEVDLAEIDAIMEGTVGVGGPTPESVKR
jgi:aryl-alcohol dehydrogenase-like predicted oxidoreductase